MSNSRVAGHFGEAKRSELVTRNSPWEKLSDWINNYVWSCDKCQYNKSPRNSKYGLLQPLEVLYVTWPSISVDFITQLAKSQGQTQIMVVVDGSTRKALFIGLVRNATAMDVADTLLEEVGKLHGFSSEIISDMVAKFCAEFWESLCKALGIKRQMTTAYHSQTDG